MKNSNYSDWSKEDFIKEIKKLKKRKKYGIVWNKEKTEEEFEDVKGMVDLKPIPEVILNVYRRIFR